MCVAEGGSGCTCRLPPESAPVLPLWADIAILPVKLVCRSDATYTNVLEQPALFIQQHTHCGGGGGRVDQPVWSAFFHP